MVNPADVLIKSSEMLRKSDAVDRCKQAWSLQGNKLKGIYTPDSISLVMCSLIRLKNSITKDTTRQKNRIKSQLRYLVIEMTWKFLEPFSNWLKPFVVWLKGGGDAHSERSLGPRHPSVRVCRTDPTSSAEEHFGVILIHFLLVIIQRSTGRGARSYIRNHSLACFARFRISILRAFSSRVRCSSIAI